MPDGNASGRGEGELPPDPWAGLAGPTPPPPPPQPQPQPPRPGQPGWGDPDLSSGRARHPSLSSGTEQGHVPPARRTMWHHPMVWVAMLILAGILLIGALLEPRTARPQDRAPDPLPDAVTALASDLLTAA